jgi:hypothetical protein
VDERVADRILDHTLRRLRRHAPPKWPARGHDQEVSQPVRCLAGLVASSARSHVSTLA